ncbi:hypothetical protein Tco_0091164 [Tanacetum coccineum]
MQDMDPSVFPNVSYLFGLMSNRLPSILKILAISSGSSSSSASISLLSSESWSVRRIEFTEYAVLFGRTDTLFRLHQSIRCLSRRFDTSYPTGGYGVSGGLPEQST